MPRSGSTSDDSWFRMSNALVKGKPPYTYTEGYTGSLSLSETIATSNCTGTIALTTGSTTVTGTGTAFVSELHIGQFAFVVDAGDNRSFLLVVEKIVSDTSFICSKAPTFSGTVTGETLVRLPVLQSLDKDRASFIWGSAARSSAGTLFTAGDGVLRLNGSALSASLTMTRAPKISLYSQAAGTYTHFTLGMATSAAPTLAAVAGGTKQMRAGLYTIVITPERTQTVGYNNPSVQTAAVTIASNDRIQITFPAMDTTNGQNAWGVWVTTYAESLGADLNYLLGPWFRLDQYTGNTAGFTTNIEWTDAEVERNDIVTFNNDAPPQAERVVLFNNNPIWISCQGIGSSTITTPGPFIFPAKPGNVEAAPVDVATDTSPSETIVGSLLAEGRLFLLTTNHLEVALSTPSDAVPVIIQPYWSSGFKGPYQLCAVNDALYGFPVSGPTRSSAEAVIGQDEVLPDEGFAADVQEITSPWIRGQVIVAHDPVNDAVCFFHCGNALNSSSFWTTRVLIFGLQQDKWIGEVTLSSTTQDMIVSGVATVSGYLEFLMGGRLSNNTVSVGTYRWDQVAGAAVDWYAAPAFSDLNSELRGHTVKRLRATAKTTSGSFGVFGTQPTESVDVTSLEAGNSSSLTGAVSIPNSTSVTFTEQYQVNAANLCQSTIRIQGQYSGSGNPERVDEILYESAIIGARR